MSVQLHESGILESMWQAVSMGCWVETSIPLRILHSVTQMMGRQSKDLWKWRRRRTHPAGAWVKEE